MKTLTTFLLLLFITNPSTAQQKELSKKQVINYIKSYYTNFKQVPMNMQKKIAIQNPEKSRNTGNIRVITK
jgi:hypothetical protein